MWDSTIYMLPDYAVLTFKNEDDLQRLLHSIKRGAEEYNIMISKNKTKCMKINKKPLRYTSRKSNDV